MPPSQLKRLKASLREQGVVGPQQSKKQKKQNAQNGVQKEKRVHRTEALNTIRDQFNPFEYKWSKTPKFGVTTNKNLGNSKGAIVGRPYDKKSRAEEEVRKLSFAIQGFNFSLESWLHYKEPVTNTLKLPQVQQGLLSARQNRRKVGGIQDRRFGENDPTMDPETKMLQRSADLAQRRSNKLSAFDLDDEEPGELTHMGQSLSLNGPDIKDDFEEELSDGTGSDLEEQSRKRRRLQEGPEDGVDSEENDEDDGRPQRKKSKQEVMNEVMAKSKLYKYERQAAKDEDEDLREDLDKDFQDSQAALRGMGSRYPPPASSMTIATMNPDRAALLIGAEKANLEKEFDMNTKRMIQEKRSIPSERTKTEEEISEETARLLRDLEERRLRRMQGNAQSSDEEDDAADQANAEDEDDDDEFGVSSTVPVFDGMHFLERSVSLSLGSH
jgi:nucleolar protein 14